ncbi:MAG: DUF2730 family protein [Magnetococcales bacterium]|nr:DUF2730 family protein [Magnetococcales bacterium]
MPVTTDGDAAMEWLLKWWPLLASAISAAAGWAYWSLQRKLVPREEFAAALEQMRASDDALEERVMRVELEIRHMPTREDVTALGNRIAGLTGDIRMMSARVDGVYEMLERMDRQFNLLLEHHMKDDGDG